MTTATSPTAARAASSTSPATLARPSGSGAVPPSASGAASPDQSSQRGISTLAGHSVVAPDQWLAERRALLDREKELMRQHDQLAAARRALPWVCISKTYSFDTPTGRRTLADLFEGRRQLMVQHFMLGPGWEQGCPSCSYMADHADGMAIHMAHRDTTFVAVSRAPLAEIARFRQRMGWKFDWVSASDSDFNQDFHVSFTQAERDSGEVFYNFAASPARGEEAPGISVFYKDPDDARGEVFHTYSTFGRGVEVMMGTYPMLDLTPLGRSERDTPYKMEWVRHHDRYPAPLPSSSSASSSASSGSASASASSSASAAAQPDTPPAASCCAARV